MNVKALGLDEQADLGTRTVFGPPLLETGGGLGVTCSDFPLGSLWPPAYSDFEDNAKGGNASIAGVAMCWLGFLRNHVGGQATDQCRSLVASST